MTEMVPAERLTRTAQPLASAVAAPPPAPPAPKRSRGKVIGLAIALAVIGGGGYFAYHYWTEGRFIVSTDDAYVKADTAIVAAKVGGYLLSVPVIENQRVRKGDVLAQVDPVDYRLAVEASRGRIETQGAIVSRLDAQARVQAATIEQAQATLAAADADRARAAGDFTRANELSQTSYGTAQRLDMARADRDRTIATVASARAQVAAAQANLAVLQAQKQEAERTRDELRTALDRSARDLDFATVRAPFDGIVGNKAAQPGMFVQPGTRLLALVPPQTAYVEANYKETQIGRLKPGQRAIVRLDAASERTVEGTVESFAPASGSQFSLLPPENATGNFTKIVQRLPIRIRLPADVANEGLFAPGLSVVVDVDTRSEPARDATATGTTRAAR